MDDKVTSKQKKISFDSVRNERLATYSLKDFLVIGTLMAWIVSQLKLREIMMFDPRSRNRLAHPAKRNVELN